MWGGRAGFTLRADPMHETNLRQPPCATGLAFNNGAKKGQKVVEPGSPVFRCRKTLTFNDSDLYSDDESGAGQDGGITINAKFAQPVARKSLQFSDFTQPRTIVAQDRADVDIVAPTGAHHNHVLRKVSNATDRERPTQDQVQRNRTSTGEITQQQAVKPVKKVVRKSVSVRNSVQSDVQSRVKQRQPAALDTARIARQDNPPSAVQKTKFAFEYLKSEPEHAYFPKKSSAPSQPPLIKKVFHSEGNPSASLDRDSTNDSVSVANLLSQGRNITVCVRKRPLLASETKRKEMDMIKIDLPSSVTVNMLKVSLNLEKYIHQHVFNFDEAFDEHKSNTEVYMKTVKPLIPLVFSRASVMCFAFGQTGAGKSYTLLGNGSVPGLYQLASHDVFDEIRRRKSHSLWVSYYEIYNNQLYDLLNRRKRLFVRENSHQRVCIAGLMETQVNTVSALVQVIKFGNSARSTGSTGVNDKSSRSHAVLQLELRDNNDTKIGRLNFIDLAGSERAADVTDSDKQTRIEGAGINQSLLALKECIRSIGMEKSHTPFRQSKLTHILRDSFMGKSHTVMIANISPSQSACENTLNALRYADRVRNLPNPNGVPESPVASEVKPSPRKSTEKKKTPTGNLFHPSNIQFSSTPIRAPPSNRRVDDTTPSFVTHVFPSQIAASGPDFPTSPIDATFPAHEEERQTVEVETVARNENNDVVVVDLETTSETEETESEKSEAEKSPDENEQHSFEEMADIQDIPQVTVLQKHSTERSRSIGERSRSQHSSDHSRSHSSDRTESNLQVRLSRDLEFRRSIETHVHTDASNPSVKFYTHTPREQATSRDHSAELHLFQANKPSPHTEAPRDHLIRDKSQESAEFPVILHTPVTSRSSAHDVDFSDHHSTKSLHDDDVDIMQPMSVEIKKIVCQEQEAEAARIHVDHEPVSVPSPRGILKSTEAHSPQPRPLEHVLPVQPEPTRPGPEITTSKTADKKIELPTPHDFLKSLADNKFARHALARNLIAEKLAKSAQAQMKSNQMATNTRRFEALLDSPLNSKFSKPAPGQEEERIPSPRLHPKNVHEEHMPEKRSIPPRTLYKDRVTQDIPVVKDETLHMQKTQPQVVEAAGQSKPLPIPQHQSKQDALHLPPRDERVSNNTTVSKSWSDILSSTSVGARGIPSNQPAELLHNQEVNRRESYPIEKKKLDYALNFQSQGAFEPVQSRKATHVLEPSKVQPIQRQPSIKNNIGAPTIKHSDGLPNSSLKKSNIHPVPVAVDTKPSTSNSTNRTLVTKEKIPSVSFLPIQSFPITNQGSPVQICEPNPVTKDKVPGEAAKELFKPTEKHVDIHYKLPQAAVVPNRTQQVDNHNHQAQNNDALEQKSRLESSQLIVAAHEHQLAEITLLCKQEMDILIALQQGKKGFQSYISSLKTILNKKSSLIANLENFIADKS